MRTRRRRASRRLRWVASAWALGRETTAVGAFATANQWEATAFGANAYAEGLFSTAIGAYSHAADVATAVGQGTFANNASLALGVQAQAAGEMSVAVGNNSIAGTSAVALGFNSLAGADGNSVTNGDHTTAVGNEAWATEDGASVVGYNSYAQAVDSTVLGSNAWTTKEASNSVSLGAGSLADRANSVSVGAAQDWTDAAGVVHSAIDRQVTNVAAGTEATDAVNKGQLDEVADSVGDANDYLSVNGLGDGSDARWRSATTPPRSAPMPWPAATKACLGYQADAEGDYRSRWAAAAWRWARARAAFGTEPMRSANTASPAVTARSPKASTAARSAAAHCCRRFELRRRRRRTGQWRRQRRAGRGQRQPTAARRLGRRRAVSNGFNSVAIGGGAGRQPVRHAVGAFATAIGWQSTAFGSGAYADDMNATAIGAGIDGRLRRHVGRRRCGAPATGFMMRRPARTPSSAPRAPRSARTHGFGNLRHGARRLLRGLVQLGDARPGSTAPR